MHAIRFVGFGIRYVIPKSPFGFSPRRGLTKSEMKNDGFQHLQFTEIFFFKVHYEGRRYTI